jgi:hypothetical protein
MAGLVDGRVPDLIRDLLNARPRVKPGAGTTSTLTEGPNGSRI